LFAAAAEGGYGGRASCQSSVSSRQKKKAKRVCVHAASLTECGAEKRNICFDFLETAVVKSTTETSPPAPLHVRCAPSSVTV
jgi:hypothetical protein